MNWRMDSQLQILVKAFNTKYLSLSALWVPWPNTDLFKKNILEVNEAVANTYYDWWQCITRNRTGKQVKLARLKHLNANLHIYYKEILVEH